MADLLRIEFAKLLHLSSLRFSLVLLTLFPVVWAFAPGIIDVFGFFVVSAFQVPALSLLTSMEFLLPLLIAIASAELVALEVTYGTLPTVLLRPVTRSKWLSSKLLVSALYPFGLLLFLLLVSLVVGFPFGYGPFTGGTGVGAGDLLGEGVMTPSAASAELFRAYVVAAASLVPVSMLSILFTVLFMNAAGGALATLSLLIFMRLLVVFPELSPFLLTSQLNAYVEPVAGLGWTTALLLVYAAAFAVGALLLFERKDF